jgi:hypothetical protein
LPRDEEHYLPSLPSTTVAVGKGEVQGWRIGKIHERERRLAGQTPT